MEIALFLGLVAIVALAGLAVGILVSRWLDRRLQREDGDRGDEQ